MVKLKILGVMLVLGVGSTMITCSTDKGEFIEESSHSDCCWPAVAFTVNERSIYAIQFFNHPNSMPHFKWFTL
jgi:hypothetical protein